MLVCAIDNQQHHHLHVSNARHEHGPLGSHVLDERGREPVEDGHGGVDDAHADEAIGVVVGMLRLDALHHTLLQGRSNKTRLVTWWAQQPRHSPE